MLNKEDSLTEQPVDEDSVDARVQYATLTGIRGWNITIEYKHDISNQWAKEEYELSKESQVKPSELVDSLKDDLNFTIINDKIVAIEQP